MLWHADTLLGNDRETSNYRTTVARYLLHQQIRKQRFHGNNYTAIKERCFCTARAFLPSLSSSSINILKPIKLYIPLIQDMIKTNINKYKNRTAVHENQLIKDLFTQTLEERRLKRIWPEDLLDEV
jgi:hypothetical protein